MYKQHKYNKQQRNETLNQHKQTIIKQTENKHKHLKNNNANNLKPIIVKQ